MSVKFRFLLCLAFFLTSLQLQGIDREEEISYVNALASMTYHLNDCQEKNNGIPFTDDAVNKLWNRICHLTPRKDAALIAIHNYNEFKTLLNCGDLEGAQQAISHTYDQVEKLWEESIDAELNIAFDYAADKPIAAELPLADYSLYPHLTKEMKKRFAPYLISNEHPMKANLEKLFSRGRVTAHRKAFSEAGFRIISERPRSYVIVAKHKALPGYLIKCYFDTEKREKWSRPSWYWLEKRCRGARVLRKIIEAMQSKYFAVAKKSLYVLPLLHPEKPYPSCYIRHPILVIVTDMKLVSDKDNLYAWRNIMDEKRLDELYHIISRAKGASYRADNIAYSQTGKFCFIDTEYPGRGPEYYRVGRELNSRMASYWNRIVTNGGPKR